MARNFRRFLLLTALVAIGFVDQAQAQLGTYNRPQTNPFGRPVISPYINLGRGGVQAFNYYGLVQPQLQATQSFQALQFGQQFQQQEINNLGQPGLNGAGQPLTTGGSYFYNFSHYYPVLNQVHGQGAGGGGVSGFGALAPGVVPLRQQ